jgi:Zn-dependent protease with chaperone function
MSLARAVLIVGVVSVVSAALLAFVSRTPAEVRAAKPGPEATDPSLGPDFTDEQISRHGAYRGPSYLSFALGTFVEIVLLAVLARGPFRRLADATEGLPGGWATRALLLGAALALATWLAQLPLSYVRGYAIAHAWGLSTQDAGGWLTDGLKAAGVGAVVTAVGALAFFAAVRWFPRAWWLIGWAAFTALTAFFAFAWPVLIAPLFNRFTPVEDQSIRARVLALAREANVDIDDVLVADASRRTTAENAYVAGLGSTKRMVLYDTLIGAGGEDETAYVVAHELGHEVGNHVLKGVAVSSAGLLAGFGLLSVLASRGSLWEWGGASGVGDPRALPLLALYVTVATLTLLPFQSAVSRHFEREADSTAIRLTEDPDNGIRVFRRLAFSNIADLRPPAVAVWALYSHPPIDERIRSVLRSQAVS